MYSKMIDNYFLHVLDIGNNDNFSELIKGVESTRRLNREEGYGAIFPFFMLKKNGIYRISTAPGILNQVFSFNKLLDRGDGFSKEYITNIENLLSKKYTIHSYWHSLHLYPNNIKKFEHSSNIEIKLINSSNKSDKFSDESIEFGTAFGAFINNKLVSWAEATPLTTVTNDFNVMLVGIETHEDYRQCGYAKNVLSKLTSHVISMGKIPLYSCSSGNIASYRTAISCGYELYGETLRFQTLHI